MLPAHFLAGNWLQNPKTPKPQFLKTLLTQELENKNKNREKFGILFENLKRKYVKTSLTKLEIYCVPIGAENYLETLDETKITQKTLPWSIVMLFAFECCYGIQNRH